MCHQRVCSGRKPSGRELDSNLPLIACDRVFRATIIVAIVLVLSLGGRRVDQLAALYARRDDLAIGALYQKNTPLFEANAPLENSVPSAAVLTLSGA